MTGLNFVRLKGAALGNFFSSYDFKYTGDCVQHLRTIWHISFNLGDTLGISVP